VPWTDEFRTLFLSREWIGDEEVEINGWVFTHTSTERGLSEAQGNGMWDSEKGMMP